jgi:transketolase
MNEKVTLTAAAEIRKLTIRAMESAGYGHIGGSMSICDLLAVLYTDVLNIDPQDSEKRDRDWVVLSKGHCGPALYAALAYRGYFKKEELATLNANGTMLPSHCDRLKTKGIDISTGSLGQGISLAAGVAVANEMQAVDSTVFVIVGDGELQEGQNWEAIQFIAHRKQKNLIIIVDNNKRQLDGYTSDICNPFCLKSKFTAFGLSALEADGHNIKEVYDALIKAKTSSIPTVVILNTEKGHGCNFAEINGFNHYMVISKEMADSAVSEVDKRLREAQ